MSTSPSYHLSIDRLRFADSSADRDICGYRLLDDIRECYESAENKQDMLDQLDRALEAIYQVTKKSRTVKLWLLHIIISVFPQNYRHIKSWCTIGLALLEKCTDSALEREPFTDLKSRMQEIIELSRKRSSEPPAKVARTSVNAATLSPKPVFDKFVPPPASLPPPVPVSVLVCSSCNKPHPCGQIHPGGLRTQFTRNNFIFSTATCRNFTPEYIMNIYRNTEGIPSRVLSLDEFSFLFDRFANSPNFVHFLYHLYFDCVVGHPTTVNRILDKVPITHQIWFLKIIVMKGVKTDPVLLNLVLRIIFEHNDSSAKIPEKIDQAKPLLAQIRKESLDKTSKLILTYLEKFVEGLFFEILDVYRYYECYLIVGNRMWIHIFLQSFLFAFEKDEERAGKYARTALKSSEDLKPKLCRYTDVTGITLNFHADSLDSEYDLHRWHICVVIATKPKLKNLIQRLVDCRFDKYLDYLVKMASNPADPIWTQITPEKYCFDLVEALIDMKRYQDALSVLSGMDVPESDMSKYISLMEIVNANVKV